ncbi:MAG: cytochrome c oxidase subunit II [Pirellula sp.]|jgi:cytochrome c oxidase subunit 2|nr:cytochrome c oxidase subunit II [Pirellula sp.]
MSFFLADQVAPYAWFPEGASSFAPQVDFLFTVILWICIVFFVPIVIAMGYFMWVYRERPGYRGSPEALHNTAIEITWTVVPTIVVVWVFWEGAMGYLDMARIPKGTVDVNVTAKKWQWAFKYENGGEHDVIPVENSSVKELPLLVLPVDRDIKMIMRSDDVLHSFYIPAFRAKRDVVPGRYNYMWFHTTKEGLYDLFCTEYCGDNHSQMNAKVKVVSQEEYKKALDKAIQEPEDPLARGQLLYKRQGCSTCHNAGAEGASGPGPSYNGSWGKPVQLESGAEVAFDENYVRESILNPQAKARKGYGKASPMNSYAGKLKDDQIDALITFIKSLENANSATKK